MNNYSYEVNKILKNAEKEMKDLKHPYVGTEHLLLSLLKQPEINKITKQYNLSYEMFKEELISIVGKCKKESTVILYTPLLRMIIDNAYIMAKKDKKEVDSIYLFKSLLSGDDGIAIRMLISMDVDIDDLYNDLVIKEDNLLKIGTNLNERKSSKLIGRDREIESIIEILLRKNKNNPLLIGEAGVGKSAIVYELANRIKKGLVPNRIKDYIIISLDMASLLSNTKYRGEFETKINDIIKEVKNNKNIVLFIDEIHTIVKSGGSDGSIDAANILKPYLASDDIKLIGATTNYEYKKYIAKDKALSRRFEKVIIKEPDLETTKKILLGLKSVYETYHDVVLSEEIIDKIIKYSDKYIKNNHNPDKSLDILDSVCSKVSLMNNTTKIENECNMYIKRKDYKNALKVSKSLNRKKTLEITDQDIIDVIESMTGIKRLQIKDYISLSHKLDKMVYGHDLKELKDILKKHIILNNQTSILFKGEKNLGKRFISKIIADELAYNYIYLDMEEFSNATSINRLIGSDPGYIGYEDETLFDKIKYNPYSLIYFDNIECASTNIMNLIKKIIKENEIIDNKGEYIDFSNTFIILGSNLSETNLGYNNSIKQELLNNVIYFKPIPRKEIKRYLKDNNIIDVDIDGINNFKTLNSVIEENNINNNLLVV